MNNALARLVYARPIVSVNTVLTDHAAAAR